MYPSSTHHQRTIKRNLFVEYNRNHHTCWIKKKKKFVCSYHLIHGINTTDIIAQHIFFFEYEFHKMRDETWIMNVWFFVPTDCYNYCHNEKSKIFFGLWNHKAPFFVFKFKHMCGFTLGSFRDKTHLFPHEFLICFLGSHFVGLYYPDIHFYDFSKLIFLLIREIMQGK